MADEEEQAAIAAEVAREEELDRRFQKFDPNGLPHHRYCQWCGKVDRGPHTGKTLEMLPPAEPGLPKRPKYNAADEERMYTSEEQAAEGIDPVKHHNLGGNVCADCFHAEMERSRAKYTPEQIEAAKQRIRERQAGGQ